MSAADQPTLAYPTDDARWEACLARSRAADGRFFQAVTTTGVYCRPSCPGRPKRENLRFFADIPAARAAGFRACKRCRPDAVQPAALAMARSRSA